MAKKRSQQMKLSDMSPSDTVNMYQAAQLAGVSRQAIFDAVNRDALPYREEEVKIKVKQIRIADLTAYLARRRVRTRSGGRNGRVRKRAKNEQTKRPAWRAVRFR